MVYTLYYYKYKTIVFYCIPKVIKFSYNIKKLQISISNINSYTCYCNWILLIIQ